MKPLHFACLRTACSLLLTGTLLAACNGGGGSSPTPRASSTPSPAPTPTPSPTPSTEAAFECPSSDTPSAGTRGGSGGGESTRQRRAGGHRATTGSAGLIAVTYAAATAAGSRSALEARERSTGARIVQELTFPRTGLTTHVLAVPPGQVATVVASLRAASEVRSVGLTGERRYGASVSTPYFPSDPYFDGFSGTGAPLYEASAIPGQWDAHVTKLEYAFGYSQANNGSGIVNANALGSSSVKIAIIDSGEDTTHPELHPKITYQKCFVTDPSGNQSTSNFTTDPDGHGTDVAGIAAEATGNGFGFAGAGGGSALYGYRVFPTPDDNCANDNTSDAQCGADTGDIASAILDAIAQGVNVISISLGGGGCTNGVDSDTVEGNAIAEAVAHNIVVVASAGNDGGPPLEAPACDTGVIAAGASALADGQLTGSGTTSGSAGSPIEYVASYSDYGSPAASPKSASAWGIVAPGGDPSDAESASGGTPDDLHWVENIWTSTPYMSSSTDTTFEGECSDDYPNSTGTTSPVDCRTLIAGTSMAAPRVAGAAALILAVNASYQSPAQMKQLLCTTADDIGAPAEGCGRLNVYRAMAVALGDPTPP